MPSLKLTIAAAALTAISSAYNDAPPVTTYDNAPKQYPKAPSYDEPKYDPKVPTYEPKNDNSKYEPHIPEPYKAEPETPYGKSEPTYPVEKGKEYKAEKGGYEPYTPGAGSETKQPGIEQPSTEQPGETKQPGDSKQPEDDKEGESADLTSGARVIGASFLTVVIAGIAFL